MKIYLYVLIFSTFFLWLTPQEVFSEKISFSILQLNDIYEPMPVLGGTRGGLGRVATIRKELLEENPQTFTILAGDFLSPSPMNNVTFRGKKLAGQHMVDIFNHLGLDFATFGNHEFDLDEHELLERLHESKFTWFTSNVFDLQGKRWPKVKSEIILEIKGMTQSLKVGLFAVSITKIPIPYVKFKEVISATEEAIHFLKKKKVDLILAVTHLSLADDVELLEHFPDIDLIMGGHDHENMIVKRGIKSRSIVKADANAKSVYIHNIDYETKTKKLNIEHIFKVVNEEIEDDKQVQKRILSWQDIAFQYFRKSNLEPSQNLGITHVDLDGRREYFRYKPNNLSVFLNHCMLKEGTRVEGSIFNVGIVRIDDIIKRGSMVSQYDMLRLMPYPEKVFVTKISGSYLKHTLNIGEKSIGKGGFLHFMNIDKNPHNDWLLQHELIRDEKSYRIAMNSFLAKTLEEASSNKAKDHKIEVIEKKDLFLKSLIKCMEK